MKEKVTNSLYPAAVVLLLAGGPAALGQDEEAVTPVPKEEIAEHPKAITHLVVGPKEQVIYTADEVGGIRAWKRAEGEFLWEVSRPMRLNGLDIGEDSLMFTIRGASFSEIVAETGEYRPGVGIPAFDLRSTCLACDPKERWVWLGMETETLVRLTPGNVNGWSKRLVENTGTLSLALDSKGKQLAIGGRDGTIRFAGGKSANVEEKKICKGHEGPVMALAFDSEGSKLASGSEDHTVRFWSVRSGKSLLVIEGHEATIRSVACDPKGRWIASGDESGVVKLWSTKGGAEVATLSEGGYGVAVALVFVDKGKTLIGAAGGTFVTIWDVSEL